MDTADKSPCIIIDSCLSSIKFVCFEGPVIYCRTPMHRMLRGAGLIGSLIAIACSKQCLASLSCIKQGTPTPKELVSKGDVIPKCNLAAVLQS